MLCPPKFFPKALMPASIFCSAMLRSCDQSDNPPVPESPGFPVPPARIGQLCEIARFPVSDNVRPVRCAEGRRSNRWSFSIPLCNGTLGCHPSFSCAMDMSGFRITGSSCGRGFRTSSDFDPVISSTISASSMMVNSTGFPRLTGPVKPLGVFISLMKPSIRSST